MKGVSLPAAKDFEWKEQRSGSLYRVKGPSDEMSQPPPKADEQLAHSQYLPRMGKNSLLRASVVNQAL